LSKDAAQRTDPQVLARLARDRYGAWLRRVPELPVAPTLTIQSPSIGLQQPDHIPNLHPAERKGSL
jgi:hypothetical protein